MTAAAFLFMAALPACWSGATAEEGSDDDHPETPGELGEPSLSGGGSAFEGTFVAGELPEAGALLSNFTVRGTPLLREVEVSGYLRAESSVEDGRVRAHGEGVELLIYDAPAAYVEAEFGGNFTVRVRLAEGGLLRAGLAGSFSVAAGPIAGVLWAACPAGSLWAEGRDLVLESAGESCTLRFRANTSFDVVPGEELHDALANGDLAAEVSVSGSGTNATTVSIAFDSVEVAVALHGARLSVGLAGNVTGGRSVMILVARSVLDDSAAVSALFDGRPVARASSTADALSAADDAGAPEFQLVSSGDLSAVILSVPSFSVHLFELSVVVLGASPTPGVPPGEAIGPLALGAAVVVAAAVALARRPE